MPTSLSSEAFGVRTVGQVNTNTHRSYLEGEGGEVLSYFHDVPLYADRQKGHLNMILEIPRWTNAKLEIATGEPMNPIRQDVKKGVLRFVKNLFPFHGYPWNYGAFPQTWEDPASICMHTGLRGDGDPIDVIDIGSAIGFTGQIRQVKVLGCIALLDEGETDWKVVAVDISDPLSSSLNDIEDVERHCPGLLDATRFWFKTYKVPDGKPENEFAFGGEFKNRAFALQIIEETKGLWENLVAGKTASPEAEKMARENKLIVNSPFKVASDCVAVGQSDSFRKLERGLVSPEVTTVYYNIFPSPFGASSS